MSSKVGSPVVGQGAAPARLGLRERKKLRTRQEIAEVAARLFAERGFDAVTVEEIAEAAEVSPSTFFRYFDSKEGVLNANGAEILGELLANLAARPDDEPVLASLRHAFVALATKYEDLLVSRASIAACSPTLRANGHDSLAAWEQAVTDAIGARLGVNPTDLRPKVMAATVLAAMRVAVLSSLDDPAHPGLVNRMTQALELLEDSFAGIAQTSRIDST
jgi:AcrR family transcriptional regulator